MTVYIDRAFSPYGRMKMCHMLADSTEELMAFALRIGMKPEWIQCAGTYKEHFDVTVTRRAIALKLGAIEITRRELAQILAGRRQGEKLDKTAESEYF